MTGLGFLLSGAGASWMSSLIPHPGGGPDLQEFVTAASCPTAQWCAAAGSVTEWVNGSPDDVPFVIVDDQGTLSTAVLPLPSDASTTSQDAFITQLSCWAPSHCALIGYYDGATEMAPMIGADVGGVWS